MKRRQFTSLLGLALLTSFSLTACGGRAPGLGATLPDANQQNPTDTAPVYESPPSSYNPGGDPYSGGNGNAYNPNPISTQPIGTMPGGQFGPANPPAGSFEVDQGNLVYNWKARGIAVSGGSIYIAAVDNEGMTKNGTVLKMDAISGKNWKDLGTSFLGISSQLDNTLQGITLAGGNIFAIDSSAGLYSIRTAGNGSVTPLKGSGGQDIAGSNTGIFVAANGIVERADMSGASRMPMPNIRATAGMGSDSRGNIYFLNGPRVGVLDPNGMPRDVVMQGLVAPLDVSGDGRNGDIYVLEQTEVKRFSAQGQLVASFPHGALQPSSIAVDESGSIYIADFSSDSKIIKFGPADGTQQPNQTPGMGMGYGQSYNNYPDPYATGGYGAPNTVPGYNTGTNYGTGGYNTGTSYGTGYNAGAGYGTGTSYGSYNVPNTMQQQIPQQQMAQPIPQPIQQTTNNRRF